MGEQLLKSLADLSSTNPNIVSLRCPHCGYAGSFHGVGNSNDVLWTSQGAHQTAGMRQCPNPACRSLVFVVTRSGNVAASYPPQVIDFDSTNLPAPILTTLEEAIKTHGAGCFKASALMVRRLLEELCEDKGASGNDLKGRLAALGKTVVIPQELLTAADELRILGNDAAHVEAKAYDAIGSSEATVAIELAKELLKAVYQYSSLLDKLKALKKP
jgi:Domain of unknown function (DUF4145)